MSRQQSQKIAFILMGIVLIEIIGLIQAVFSQQVIKYNIEKEVEHNSEMLLSQFVETYETNRTFQNNITKLNEEHFDNGLLQMYKSIQLSLASAGEPIQNQKYTSDQGDYQVEIMDNNEGNLKFFNEQLGLDVSKIIDYRIISYEMKQSSESLLERRFLIGRSQDQKKIITIEVNLKDTNERLLQTNQALGSLLNSAYYFTDKTGNYYVFTSSGKVIYQGGLEKNAYYFKNIDLNSNERIIDIIRQETTLYRHVIYEKNSQINRSMIHVLYDKENSLYYVYEVDQKKIFHDIEHKLMNTWFFGLIMLTLTITALGMVGHWSKKSYSNKGGK